MACCYERFGYAQFLDTFILDTFGYEIVTFGYVFNNFGYDFWIRARCFLDTFLLFLDTFLRGFGYVWIRLDCGIPCKTHMNMQKQRIILDTGIQKYVIFRYDLPFFGYGAIRARGDAITDIFWIRVSKTFGYDL